MADYDITALDSALEFDTTSGGSKSIARIPGTDRVIVAWIQSTSLPYAQAFNVNTSSGAVTAIGSPVDLGTAGSASSGISIVCIDGSNAAVFYNGTSDDGFCQLLSIDGSGNVSLNGSATEYDTSTGQYPYAILIDSTHILNAWSGGGTPSGRAAVFTVNTGAGTISLTGSAFAYTTGPGSWCSLAALSSTKYVVAYRGPNSDGYMRVLDVNTSTWEVTGAGAEFRYKNSDTIWANSVVAIDTASSPMIVSNTWASQVSNTCACQTFEIDTSTWAITAFGSELALASSITVQSTPSALVDSSHIVVTYTGAGGDGFVRVLTYDDSTGDLTTTANAVEFDTADYEQGALVLFSDEDGFFVLAWSGTSSVDGYIQSFDITMPSSSFVATPMIHMMGIAGGLS